MIKLTVYGERAPLYIRWEAISAIKDLGPARSKVWLKGNDTIFYVEEAVKEIFGLIDAIK